MAEFPHGADHAGPPDRAPTRPGAAEAKGTSRASDEPTGSRYRRPWRRAERGSERRDAAAESIPMTSRKQLKARIRARMARTGESYSTAHRHVAGPSNGSPAPVEHCGYRLRGGVHPVSSSLANVLAHHGVRAGGGELSEALVFGIAGGPGAGYILWEFAHSGPGPTPPSRPLVLGVLVVVAVRSTGRPSPPWSGWECRCACTAPVARSGPRAPSPHRWTPGTPRSCGPTGSSPGTGSCRRRWRRWAGTPSSSTAPTPGPTASTTATWRH